MTEILAFNVVEKSQKIDKPKISIDESIKKQKIIGLKTDFIGLNEVFEQIKDIKDLKQNGFVNKDEFFMTSAQLEAKKQQIINKINNNISSDEVAKQELVNIVKDLLIPEWYEIPLIALPITQEGIVLTKSVKLIKAIERFEKNYDKIKLLFKNDNFFKTIENLIAKLKVTFDTKNLEYLINGLRKDSNKILNTQKQ
ncbi:hypothetical protein KAZ01_01760, partial [Candidatus Gracilibacteria bacterium]|nr:hypothetical protein [Candidatus Gracilibacteria bacterium]